MEWHVIHLHPRAPAKPAPGAACNGCGVCCAWQPCPLGVLVSRRRQGACRALRWDEAGGQYRCGLLSAPREVWPALPAALAPTLTRLARHWIAAGAGCDCAVEVGPTDNRPAERAESAERERDVEGGSAAPAMPPPPQNDQEAPQGLLDARRGPAGSGQVGGAQAMAMPPSTTPRR